MYRADVRRGGTWRHDVLCAVEALAARALLLDLKLGSRWLYARRLSTEIALYSGGADAYIL